MRFESVWPIYLITALSSGAGAFDLPARQALVPTLVPREHLPNALTLTTTAVQAALVTGPSLGGVVIAAAGVGWVYVVNMVFFMGRPQLGELEAGLVANWIGAPLSVVTGGLGCLAATGYVAATTPRLWAYRREETWG